MDATRNLSVSAEEVQAELVVMFRSPIFIRAERTQRFLRYVCDLTVQGEGSRINEYLIGSEVFGCGNDYSPHENSIVRRQAHTLRQKLEEYYAKEGRDDPIRIELPVGHYVPVFHRKEERSSAPWPAATDRRAAGSRARPTILVASAGVLIFAAGWLLGLRTRVPSGSGLREEFAPAILEIWSPWFEDRAGVSICFSNPMTAVIKRFAEPLPPNFPLHPMPASRNQEKRFRESLNLPSGGYVYLTPSISQAKMGEALGSVSLVYLFSRVRVPVRTTQSRFLSWEALRSENVILLGNNQAEANPWLDPLLEKYPFRLAGAHGERPHSIINTQPEASEEAEYWVRSVGKDEATQEFALISMIPGLDAQKKLLLIDGLDTESTRMAAEFLTNPAYAEELVARLRQKAPGHHGRWYFQAVLQTEVRDRVPLRASVIALRVFQFQVYSAATS